MLIDIDQFCRNRFYPLPALKSAAPYYFNSRLQATGRKCRMAESAPDKP
jgi:hypothetical protein